jgi:pSer/pThr/pTyr-binding forkhead associated (FHA) protein
MAMNSGLTRKCERCGGDVPNSGQCVNCADNGVSDETSADVLNMPTGGSSKNQPINAALVMRGTNERFPLTQSVSKIGRDQTNSIPLPKDSYISRHHAWVLYIKGNYWVEDLGSTNGTLLNGEVLNERKQIFPGDCLKLGRTELVFEMN